MLDDTSRRTLLRLARTAIARAIGATPIAASVTPPTGDGAAGGAIRSRAGVFVTLRAAGRLRGCIGYPDAELSLGEAVAQCAVSAAISDPRFPAVRLDEFHDIHIEISVLGTLEPVSDIARVVVGRHGLIVEQGRSRGLLLPQIAIELNWTAAELASQTCVKAGLRRDAWQNGARLFTFEAEVFGEEGCGES